MQFEIVIYCEYISYIYNVLAVTVFTSSSQELWNLQRFYRPSSTSLLFSPSSTKMNESIQKPALNADHTQSHQHGIAKIPGNHYASHLLAADGCLFILIQLLLNGSSDHNLVICLLQKPCDGPSRSGLSDPV